MPEEIITSHFRRAYTEHVGGASDNHIFAHIKSAEPVTDIELTVIRATKPNGLRLDPTKDKEGLLHLIDRNLEIVFVVKKTQDGDVHAITCYDVPYLRNATKCMKK